MEQEGTLKIAIGGISQETNSFSQVPCDLDFFRRRGKIYFVEGSSLIHELAGSRTEIGGFLAAAEEEGQARRPIEVQATFASRCMSSGPLTEEALEWMLERILSGLREAGPVDGVLLAMHGGMMAQGHDDATGYVLRRVRELLGPATPLGVTLDLHANPYPKWTELADIIVSYRTYPHLESDMFSIGREVAVLLFRTCRGEIRPRVSLAKAPMLVQPEGQATTGDQPLARLIREAQALTAAADRILAISLLPVQPWLDVAGLGFSVLVVTDDAPAIGEQAAQELAQKAWDSRYAFQIRFYSPQEAIERALSIPGGPVVLSDPADGVGGGAAGDGTHLLRALLEADLNETAMVTVIDPEAVQQACAAGLGTTITLMVGGKKDTVFNQPQQVTGRVKTITDASYRAYGVQADMGRCVVLEIGTLDLLLISNTVHVINPWVYRAVGLEPAEAKIVVVKSPAQFREEFEPIAREIIMVDAPGICSPNYPTLPYQKIVRPLFPWDDNFR